AAIRNELGRREWSLERIEMDVASGSSTSKRPGLERALAAMITGHAEALVVSKVDRLTRSLLDFAAILEHSRQHGWQLIALDLGVDTTTPTGEMMANILAVFAQFERRLISQRTRDALVAKRRAGVTLGRPSVLPGEVVRQIEEWRAAGTTLAAIAERLNADAVQPHTVGSSGGQGLWQRCCGRGEATAPPRLPNRQSFRNVLRP